MNRMETMFQDLPFCCTKKVPKNHNQQSTLFSFKNFFLNIFSDKLNISIVSVWNCHLPFHSNIETQVKPEELRSLGECSSHTMCHMSHFMCHMSHVTCHASCVMCHMSRVTCHESPVTCQSIFLTFLLLFKKKNILIQKLEKKIMELVGSGSVINRAYPV